jgi:hypothetical protein
MLKFYRFYIAQAVDMKFYTGVRVCLKSGLESDFAGLGLGLRAKRLGLRLGNVGLGLGLGLEHVTLSPSLGLPISLELVQRPLEKLNQLNNGNIYSLKNFGGRTSL